jgi:hypothetical protein
LSTGQTDGGDDDKGYCKDLEVLSTFGKSLGGRGDGLRAVAAETHFVIKFWVEI